MAVSIKNVSVSFPGVKALSDASITFEDKRIHAVLGANGSGKSTLVKVLTGIYHADKGCGAQINIDGKSFNDIVTPNAAESYGVRVVHQESPLLFSFSVAECIALFKGFKKKGVFIDWDGVNAYAQELLDLYRIPVTCDTLTDDLSAAERNMVAMAMAMGNKEESKSCRILILDEADASIPEAETDTFLTHVRNIANMGIPVLMVTHRMKEVMQYCDDITILNGGEIVYQGLKDDTTEELIVSKMIRQVDTTVTGSVDEKSGRTIDELWKLLDKKSPQPSEKPVLTMADVVAKNLNGLSFSVKPGEILGIIGNPDSGVRELPQVLGGDMEIESGSYEVDGQNMPASLTPRKCFKRGVSVLPCDRPVRGGIMSCTLEENIMMPNFTQFWNRGKLKKDTMQLCDAIFDIQPQGAGKTAFGKFSGGNQQKAIMAKWLSGCPKVFVLDDPTYGVDPASRMRIFAAMRDAAKNNVAIIMFSTEPEQMAGLCTRVLALKSGRVVQELSEEAKTLDRNTIARWCYE